MFADRIRAMGAAHWLLLFGVILGAWTLLYAMAVPADLRDASQIFGQAFWRDLCAISVDGAGFLKGIGMWGLMALAMMLPSALPAFATYDDLARVDERARFGVLIGGYLLVWGGFAVLAAGLQLLLLRLDAISAFGESRSALLSAGLLAVAGAYQFTPLKDACLSKCRAPIAFFMQHWEEGPLRNGVRLGLVCLGCCWALMLLAFVGGVMSLAFMAVATLLMMLEKLPDLGRWLSAPLGVALLVASGWIGLTGF